MNSQSHILLILFFLSIVLCHLILKRHVDFRERFLARKTQRQIKSQIPNSNGTESLDDILHYKQIENSTSWKWEKIKSIEKDFRRLLAMNGMKYNYKRDFYWRTWRSVFGTGDKKFVSYKCNNPIQVNATTGNQNCGMWTIEEGPPPCPYEIFSMIDDQKLCGANFTQFKDMYNSCPLEMKLSDMTATCDNPIETVWRFKKLYGVRENDSKVICAGKDFCEILTIYEISPEHIAFRIINSTNEVIYSRIMKPNNANYVCLEDCGRFNPATRKVAKTDKPLKLNLLSPRLSKRDIWNENVEESSLSTENTTEVNPGTTDLKTNTLSMSKNGGNSTTAKKTWSSEIKQRQKSLGYNNNLDKQFEVTIERHSSPNITYASSYQTFEREGDHVSYDEENEEDNE